MKFDVLLFSKVDTHIETRIKELVRTKIRPLEIDIKRMNKKHKQIEALGASFEEKGKDIEFLMRKLNNLSKILQNNKMLMYS